LEKPLCGRFVRCPVLLQNYFATVGGNARHENNRIVNSYSEQY
jgi:hypothetical protein